MFPTDISAAALRFAIFFVPAVFGIVCHEVAHGWIANKQGDPTARLMGRLTLNPLKHVDPTGLLVFVLTAIASPFVIGWAKPVPVNPYYFKRPREGMVFVSIAGPMANFLVALLCACILRLLEVFLPYPAAGSAVYYLAQSADAGIWINCTLAWFNLMPVPPLDGSHIVAGLLPAPVAEAYQRLGRYGILIIIALLYFGLFGLILRPLVMDSAAFIRYLATFL